MDGGILEKVYTRGTFFKNITVDFMCLIKFNINLDTTLTNICTVATEAPEATGASIKFLKKKGLLLKVCLIVIISAFYKFVSVTLR